LLHSVVFPLATEYSEWIVQRQLACAATTDTLLSLENDHPLVASAEGKAVPVTCHEIRGRGEV